MLCTYAYEISNVTIAGEEEQGKEEEEEVRIEMIVLTFPLGLLVEAGYRKIPPYFRVLCMSATIDPTYRAPIGGPPSYVHTYLHTYVHTS